ncbi:YkvI family membrane protein [Corynebacterium minutissimum]|uniref:Hypothetical membrane protein n=1 Tax=Corynebacterium minutissimum TaxID=38301 RepID=A0A376CX62_9CORY|nr:hypothetical protein [Corynebacterium minutissimum]QRP60832.1 hypothetical protein I6J26_11910 [Corynebacterium minutissimum]STC77353.1 hypothetical membrane protein [Corynebacterium minutissimum]
MSYKNVAGIALSFIGLLVGAGFATGQEVVQYFTSFGINGIWGIVVAGLVMTLAGTVFLQLGSYFHASEHNQVFRNITHPIISRILDVAVILTLFAVGFVMLAGAGSNMQQQFGWPAWIGSLLMLVLVLVTGMMDVDKVSRVIGLLTPSIIIAVLFVGVYTLMHMPENVSAAIDASAAIESPIPNWLVSALNYNGLALILAVSMSLVIGGDNISPREAGWGGIVGGAVYAVLMGIAGFSLLMNAEAVGESDIPMLTLVDEIHPTLGLIMAVIIYLMIFNTAIGMFYALGKRLSSGNESKYRIIFIAGCLAGFAVSFAGFKALMQYVYPVLGYMGIVLVAILVFGWLRSLGQIKDEGLRRERIRALLHLKLHPDEAYDAERYDDEIGQQIADSNMDDEALYEDLVTEVVDELHGDDDVDFDKEKWEESRNDHTYYTERDGVEQDRSEEEIKEWVEETGAVGDPAEDEPVEDRPAKN